MSVDVVIAGAGPNGLMLACELALAGVRPVVLEALPAPADAQRANGLLGQVVRVLDHRGLFQRAQGDPAPPRPAPRYPFAGLGLDLTGLGDRNPLYGMLMPQREWEALLADRAAELGVETRRGHRLIGFTDDDTGVTVEVATDDGEHRLRTRYLVGADGGRSTVRRLAGIGFPGTTTDLVSWVAHADLPADRLGPDGLRVPGFGTLRWGHHHTPDGVATLAVLGPQGPIIGAIRWGVGDRVGDAPVTLAEVGDAVEQVLGAAVPLRPPSTPGPHYLRRTVGMNTRLAERYRAGRVFLVGDAAHVHSAIGGPGLNLGTQDAVNLGWKLAAAVHGRAPAGLLDSYQTERYPVGQRVMTHTLAQLALLRPGPETVALRDLMAGLITLPEVTAALADTLAGADVRYDPGGTDPHPLTGYFVPEFAVTTRYGTRRVAELLRAGRPVLLDLAEGTAAATAAGWADRVDILAGTGSAPAAALLIRPDGYVAWATDDPTSHHGLTDTLRRWFGAAADIDRSNA